MNTSGIVRLRKSRDKVEIENQKLREKIASLERDVNRLQERSIAQTNAQQRSYWLGYEHGQRNQKPSPPKETGHEESKRIHPD